MKDCFGKSVICDRVSKRKQQILMFLVEFFETTMYF